jgi:hypothetical protein
MMLAALAHRFGITWPEVAWGVVLFVLSAAGSLAIVTLVLVRLPATYFAGDGPRLAGTSLVKRLGKNVLGVFLVAVGVVLSIPGVPGQGVLTILIGVMLIDFPGKRRIERRIVSAPKVHKAIDDLRGRFGRAPLVIDADAPADGRRS